MAQAQQREIRVPVSSSGVGSSGEIVGLRKMVSELEDEVEALQVSVSKQELFIVDGYLVCVRPGTTATLIARCPTLRAVAQGESLGAVIADLRDAMAVSIEGRRQLGDTIPEKDTESKWLD